VFFANFIALKEKRIKNIVKENIWKKRKQRKKEMKVKCMVCGEFFLTTDGQKACMLCRKQLFNEPFNPKEIIEICMNKYFEKTTLEFYNEVTKKREKEYGDWWLLNYQDFHIIKSALEELRKFKKKKLQSKKNEKKEKETRHAKRIAAKFGVTYVSHLVAKRKIYISVKDGDCYYTISEGFEGEENA
jgi:nitrogen regulatory protein PII